MIAQTNPIYICSIYNIYITYLVSLGIWNLYKAICFYYGCMFYQVKLLVLSNVQITNLTFVGKTINTQDIDIALCNFK